jgi:glucokinase
MSSGTSFGRILTEHDLETGTMLETIISRADKNDPVATSVMRVWGVPLCVAIDTIASVLDPEIVLLGGGLGQWGWEVVKRVGRKPSWGELCPVAPATLGDEAGIIGAALAALRAGSKENSWRPGLERAP